jgi:hypothetical protein
MGIARGRARAAGASETAVGGPPTPSPPPLEPQDFSLARPDLEGDQATPFAGAASNEPRGAGQAPHSTILAVVGRQYVPLIRRWASLGAQKCCSLVVPVETTSAVFSTCMCSAGWAVAPRPCSMRQECPLRTIQIFCMGVCIKLGHRCYRYLF